MIEDPEEKGKKKSLLIANVDCSGRICVFKSTYVALWEMHRSAGKVRHLDSA